MKLKTLFAILIMLSFMCPIDALFSQDVEDVEDRPAPVPEQTRITDQKPASEPARIETDLKVSAGTKSDAGSKTKITATKSTNKPEKKKITKKIKVKYKDLNVVIGIRKEVYFNFPLGTIRPPTNAAVYKYEVNYKKDNPKLERDRVVITGLQSGITDMWVYDDQDVLRYVYNVTVTQQNLKRILGFLKGEFRHIEGLKMYIRERRVVLDGEILLPEDIARIHQVIGGGDYTGNELKIQYRLSPTLFKVVAEKMEKEIGLPSIQVEVVNQRFVLKGEVRDLEELRYVVYKASLYLPKYFYVPLPGDPSGAGDMVPPAEEFRNKPIIDFFVKILDPDKPISRQVKVVVYFVEIANGFENMFGFNWAPSINSTNTNVNMSWSNPAQKDNTGAELPALTTTLTGVITNFIPKLQSAIKNNRGRVIQSSAITIEDEQQGTISKITKYPYIVKTENAIDTKEANVGVEVKLKPKILGSETTKQTSDDINLQVDIGVSQVVGYAEGVSIPITSQDSVSTFVNLKSNETAAIGGIVQSNISKSYGDGSSDPNVIISLSRSKSFTKGKSQFVVFITPTILKAASEGSDSAKEKFRIK